MPDIARRIVAALWITLGIPALGLLSYETDALSPPLFFATLAWFFGVVIAAGKIVDDGK